MNPFSLACRCLNDPRRLRSVPQCRDLQPKRVKVNESHSVLQVDTVQTLLSGSSFILADCAGTTRILIMGPMFVGSVSAKLSTLNSLSLAMFRKFSLRPRSAGESENTQTFVKVFKNRAEF